MSFTLPDLHSSGGSGSFVAYITSVRTRISRIGMDAILLSFDGLVVVMK